MWTTYIFDNSLCYLIIVFGYSLHFQMSFLVPDLYLLMVEMNGSVNIFV